MDPVLAGVLVKGGFGHIDQAVVLLLDRINVDLHLGVFVFAPQVLFIQLPDNIHLLNGVRLLLPALGVWLLPPLLPLGLPVLAQL